MDSVEILRLALLMLRTVLFLVENKCSYMKGLHMRRVWYCV